MFVRCTSRGEKFVPICKHYSRDRDARASIYECPASRASPIFRGVDRHCCGPCALRDLAKGRSETVGQSTRSFVVGLIHILADRCPTVATLTPLGPPVRHCFEPCLHDLRQRFWSVRGQRDSFLPRWNLCGLEPYVTDINGNHKHFHIRPAVRPARVRAALGRKMNSIRDEVV